MSLRDSLEIARKQLEFARHYMLGMIADVPDADWFRVPEGAVTHIGWQVGHLAMAEYGLCLFRVRGRRAEDGQLMSSEFRKQFSKGSRPNPDPTANPSPAEIRAVLARVHSQVLSEMANYTEEELSGPVEEPRMAFENKLGAIFFCAAHEMLHAGQIGLLRRMLGKEPVR